VNLNDYNEEEIMKFGGALSFLLLVDKLRISEKNDLLIRLPPEYTEKLQLQIPDDMNKLLIDVTLSLMEKRGFKRWEAGQAATFVEKAERKEYGGMFEAMLESVEEGYERALAKGKAEGKEVGRAEGLKEGRAEGARMVANLKKLGISDDIIAQAASLSAGEKIANYHEKND
jgi:hypothetical protein